MDWFLGKSRVESKLVIAFEAVILAWSIYELLLELDIIKDETK